MKKKKGKRKNGRKLKEKQKACDHFKISSFKRKFIIKKRWILIEKSDATFKIKEKE